MSTSPPHAVRLRFRVVQLLFVGLVFVGIGCQLINYVLAHESVELLAEEALGESDGEPSETSDVDSEEEYLPSTPGESIALVSGQQPTSEAPFHGAPRSAGTLHLKVFSPPPEA